MSELADFLAARLDDDERIARAANVKQDDPEWWCSPVVAAQASGRHGATTVRSRRDNRPMARVESCSGDGPNDITDGTAVAEHVARHDPARTFQEVGAGRAALTALEQARTRFERDRKFAPGNYHLNDAVVRACDLAVRQRAAVYSDHPGYREEWKP